jgi:hypothetical protein
VSATSDAAAAAMSVPGINRAEFRPGPDGPVGTVRYCPEGLFGADGPVFGVRQDRDGWWNVNGFRARELPAAIRAAIAADLGESHA